MGCIGASKLIQKLFERQKCGASYIATEKILRLPRILTRKIVALTFGTVHHQVKLADQTGGRLGKDER